MNLTMKKQGFVCKSNNKIISYLILLFLIAFGIFCFVKVFPKSSFGADNPDISLQANIVKYLNYKISDQNKGTLLQFNIKSALNNNEGIHIK